MTVKFTTQQKEYLNKYLNDLGIECYNIIMNDNFEGTENSFKKLFCDNFKFNDLNTDYEDFTNKSSTAFKNKKKGIKLNKKNLNSYENNKKRYNSKKNIPQLNININFN